MVRFFTKKAVIILAGALYVGGGLFGMSARAEAPIVTGVTGIAQAVASPFSEWLGRLEWAESRDSGDSHLKILDHNHKYSYGCLQFQAATFLEYGKRYGLIPDGLTLTTVEPLIYGCSLQKQIAADMIENNYNNWRQWYNSATKVIGLPPHAEAAMADEF
jgi:hypothetical protein